MPGLLLGDVFPDFNAETSVGKIESFYKWIGDRARDCHPCHPNATHPCAYPGSSAAPCKCAGPGHFPYPHFSWAMLFSHPADFTPVCTTELARAAAMQPQFAQRNVKLIALSCDTAASHVAWIEDVKAFGGLPSFDFPIIADPHRELADSGIDPRLGMMDPNEKDSKGLPLTCRAVFVIGPDKRLRLSILYPATTGRNFDELLRCVDSLQLTEKHKVATPVDWTPGAKCMVLPNISDADAKRTFPSVLVTPLPSGREYLRMTEMPM